MDNNVFVRQKLARGVPVLARVKGFNDTHVLMDVKVGNGPWLKDQNRTLAGFCYDYGLV